MSDYVPSKAKGKPPVAGDTVHWRETSDGDADVECGGEALAVTKDGHVQVRSPLDGQDLLIHVRSLVDPPGAVAKVRGALRRVGRRLSKVRRALADDST